jgi:hypothetical protein
MLSLPTRRGKFGLPILPSSERGENDSQRFA